MKVDCSRLRILLVGSYPPPYGGIASLFENLLPGLKNCSAHDVTVLHFGGVNKTEQVGESFIYRYNLKNQFWRILLLCDQSCFARYTAVRLVNDP